MSLSAFIESELEPLGPSGVRVFDVHAHTGTDVDGTKRSSAEHVADLAPIDARSVIFPLCVRSGYGAENRRVVEECAAEPGRVVAFARLDPRTAAVGAQAEEALALGAKGFKLHPRSEDFRLDHPGVEEIVAVAASARVPVVIHAGLGVGSFGPTILALAEGHRACPLILAHAGISDLRWLWEEIPANPNVLFDTSWWLASDLIALFALVPPGRILFGSDAPYMDFATVLAITLRCARAAGLSAEAIELVAGGQLENLLAGNPALEAGPAPGPPPAPSPEANRATTALAAAGGAVLGGGDPAQMAELAGLAIGDGSNLGESGPAIAELVAEGLAAEDGAPWSLAAALALLATPGVELRAASR